MREFADVPEVLWSEGEIVLYRTRTGSEPALILAASSTLPSPATEAWLERAFELRHELDPAWSLRPTALVREQGRLLLKLGDPGGQALARLCQEPLETEQVLRIGLGIAKALAGFHSLGLIHRDVKPASILVKPETGSAWLYGNGLALRAPRQRQALLPPEKVAGTLAYMAPEQTGRMNRSVDARSDLYAFGVVLYQMSTGALPFVARDPMELVHGHIARRPVPPRERAPAIPETLSALIMKLLAKVPEERYQTAEGAEADLRRCLVEWEGKRRIAVFALGTQDTSDRLLIPETLYGRERECGELLAAFERVVAQGRPELVLVSGHSGVGKSSVVHELHKSLVLPRGLFASGKFDQYHRDIPYATLAQAFQRLVGVILSGTDDELARYRATILEAVGPYGQLIVSLVPDLERVIGKQAAAPELAPKDAKNVFEQIFRRFVGVFARPEHPLALFLDDLQWLDAATLDLLQPLVLQSEGPYLLLIGAYRDNEVGPGHPLASRLERLRVAGAPVHEIALSSLGREDVKRLVSDTLKRSDVGALAALVHEKTGGNPLFASQFLTALADDGLVTFDRLERRWVWDLGRIAAKKFTDNIVTLMTAKIARLHASASGALQKLGCLGNTARAETLAVVLEATLSEVHAALEDAVRAGLIARQGDSYTFLHDRIHEAAYASLAEPARPATHLLIGRRLAARLSTDDPDESVFEVVNQLNRGSHIISDQTELDRFAALNLMAGRRAQAAPAHVSALTFLRAGERQLGDDGWQRQRDLAFALAFARAESELLSGDIAAADARLEMLVARANGLVELAAVTSQRIALFTTLGRPDRAVEVALQYLEQAGISFSLHPTREESRAEYDRVWQQLGERTIEQLLELPTIRDPVLRGTMDVLAAALPPAWFIDSELPVPLIARLVSLSIEHGNCPASAYGYVMMGMKSGPHFGDYQTAYRFAKVGFDLVEKPGFDRFKPGVYLTYAMFVRPWTRGLEGSLELIERGFEAAERIGDLTFAVYILCGVDTWMLIKGSPLSDAERASKRALDYARGVNFEFVATLVEGKLRLSRMLQGLTESFGSLDDGDNYEQSFESLYGSIHLMALPACWHWIRRLQARFLAGDAEDAVIAAERAASVAWPSTAFLEYAELHFYGALARASCCETADVLARQALRQAIGESLERLSIWAGHSPEIFGARASLVAAQLAKIDGDERRAMDLYEQAIRSARDQGATHVEAIACEAAAGFYRARGFERIAETYIRDARASYLRWGALGKVRQLERLHPGLLGGQRTASLTSTIDQPVQNLDVAAVVRAAQALSSETALEQLVEIFVRLATEHGGAERALLLLPQRGTLYIEAEATTSGTGLTVEMRRAPITPDELPESVFNYAVRTRTRVLLDDAPSSQSFASDAYIVSRQPRAVLCLPLLTRTRLAGLLYLENRVASHAFEPSGIAVLEVLASLAAIAFERVRGEADLRRSEAHLAEAQQLSRTGSWSWNLSTGEIVWSAETYRIFEYDPMLKPTLERAQARAHPDDAQRVQADLMSAAERGEDWSLDYRLRMPNGVVKVVHVNARALPGQSGKPEFVGAIMDVTSVKQEAERLQLSLDDKNALLKEVHHRVKNNLQLISSLFSLQAARTTDPAVRELFADSKNRIRSMALVHENLYRASNFARIAMADHLENLCTQLARAYGLDERRIELVTEAGELSLDIDRAVSCGLIINELVSNALKHAFPAGRAGTVWVSLQSSGDCEYVLEVRDDGVGLSNGRAPSDSDSLGLQLVQDLTGQLGGDLERVPSAAGGTRFTITFPAK